jgi:hypothetical protein
MISPTNRAPSPTPAPPACTTILDTNNETDKSTVTPTVPTPHPRPKRKPDTPSQQKAVTNTHPKQKQCVLQEFYNPQSWYNTPPFSQNPTLHTFKASPSSLKTLDQSTMAALRLKVLGFSTLTNDEYVELAATINKQMKLTITDAILDVADYQLAHERSLRNEPPTSEPKAKRLKNEILDSSKYSELALAVTAQYKTTVSTKDIAFMDLTLQNHRSHAMALSLLKAPIIDITGDTPPTVPIFPPSGKRHAIGTTATITPTQVQNVKEENTTVPTAARRSLFLKTQTFTWQALPTTERDHCITTASFLKTIPTVYPLAERPLLLSCEYEQNPRFTLEALLTIIGTSVPTEFLDKMFSRDHTLRTNTINSIFKQNNADQHFQFMDYATAVVNRNLTSGMTQLFTGESGDNFSGPHGFTTDTPILCQMEMAAPDRSTNRKSYQWMLFFPRMNLVATCHNYNDKHAWTLGKETIEALLQKDDSFINTRLGKLAFPHKQDNVRSLKFISAVFVAPKNSNFDL